MLKEAKESFASGRDGLARWFTGKYKLPTNDALFQQRSQAEMLQEMYSDLLHERASTRAQIASIDSSSLPPMAKNREKRSLFARLNALNDSLGEPREADDPLLDEMESALQRGEELDLERLRPKPKPKP